MPTAQQLRDTRANLWENMKEILDTADAEGRNLTVEERTKYDGMEADLDAHEADILRMERHEARAASYDAVDRSGVMPPRETLPNDEARTVLDEAFQIFVQNGMGDLDSEQRQALRARFHKWSDGEVRAAQGVGSGSAGGYLVPEGFRKQVIEKQKAYGSVESVATILNTDTGAVLPWPTNDDTSNVGALLAENTQASEQDLTLGTEDLGAYKYTSKIVRVSIEFLQDVDWVDAEGFLQRKLAERLARIHNQHFTTGTGSSQPQGIVTGAANGKTAAAQATFTADELIDLQHSIDPAYRNERSKFMLSDAALVIARKLKDSQNRYLFEAKTTGDVPSLIAGSEYVVNTDMAVPAAEVKSVLYGDFETGFVIRKVKAFELIRLEERYADYGQVGFIGFDRADSVVQDNSAYKALTQAAA